MLLFKITLILALAVWLLAMVSAYHFGSIGRKLMKQDHKIMGQDAELPPLSVVIVAHNQAAALRRHLPIVLEQDYDRFEVIVVDMASDDETKDILERLELTNANLRHTFTPASARDISIERLALTLGFRSATHEWVVLTRADCEPLSTQWLTRIGETITTPKQFVQNPRMQVPDMVLGVALYDEQRSTWLDLQSSFYRLWHEMANINHVLGGHAAVHADNCNLAVRKSFFMESGGFSAGHNLKAGAEELLVNHTSRPNNTAVVLSPMAMIIQDRIGSTYQWKQQLMYYAETRSHQRHATLYRIKQAWQMLIPWIVIVAIIVPLILSLLLLTQDNEGVDATQIYVLIAVLPVLLITYIATKIAQFYKTTNALGCHNYIFSFLPLELHLPIRELSAWLARRFTSDKEFRKKFV